MSDRILAKYTDRVGTDPDVAGCTDVDAMDDMGCFGFLRGIRDRAISLELRKKTGNIMAIGYAWIERLDFDPSEGITLHALGQTIRIKGQHLNSEIRPMVRLFEGITRHRVSWVVEADQVTRLQAGPNATLIEAIEW